MEQSNEEEVNVHTKPPANTRLLTENERNFLNLVENGCNMRQKLRLFFFLFPLSMVALLHVFIVHSSSSRLRSFFPNNTIDAHFYGVNSLAFIASVEEGEETASPAWIWLLEIYLLYVTFTYYKNWERISSSLLAHYGIVMFMLTVLYLILQHFGCFSVFMAVMDRPPAVFKLEIIYAVTCVIHRLCLLTTYALLLTFVQEVVPKKNRSFATSIFCSADSVANCASYFIVKNLNMERTSLVGTPLTVIDAISWYDIVLLFLFWRYFGELSGKRQYDPVYNLVNNWKGLRDKNEIHLLTASFKYYWMVDIDKVDDTVYTQLEEDRCITRDRCEEHNSREDPELYCRVFAVQLSCCILQLPIQMLLQNMIDVFQRFEHSHDSAISFTHVLYVLYAISSLFSIGIIDCFSRKKIVLCAAILSLLCLLVTTPQYHIFPGVLYPERLLFVMTTFVIVNGLLLVPTAWTIIGDITGKHREAYGYENTIFLPELVIWIVFVVVYMIAIGTIARLYDELHETTKGNLCEKYPRLLLSENDNKSIC